MNGAGSFPCTVDFHAIKLGHRLQHRAGIHPQVPFDGAALPFFPFVLPVFFFCFILGIFPLQFQSSPIFGVMNGMLAPLRYLLFYLASSFPW